MTLMPQIRAQVVERFIFNFRLPASTLESRLPASLQPQLIDGDCAASFCVLNLTNVTFGPVPDALGVQNMNCAHRFGVIDRESGGPAVYVTERNTNSRLAAFITSLGCPGRHPLVNVEVHKTGDECTIRVSERDDLVFAATVRPTETFASKQFATLPQFEAFLAAGVRSYCPARNPNMLSIVDLHKDEQRFEPLTATNIVDTLISEWAGRPASAILDSAVRTGGSKYVWEYCGRRPNA